VVCCEVELLLSGDYKVRDGGLVTTTVNVWVVCCEVELLLSGDYKVRDGGLVTTTVNVGGLL